MDKKPLKNFLYGIADDHLILGHRNSEWTGLGPLLEEDIAFSNMAQDKLGVSLAVYEMLHSLGEAAPDTVAFTRKEKEYKCCQYVEYPIGEYDFSLMRHFLFDHAAYIRFSLLCESSFSPLAKFAVKAKSEIKYHIMHANTWIEKLGNANEESHARMQSVLNDSFSLSLGIFETLDDEEAVIDEKIFPGENFLKEQWIETIRLQIGKSNLQMPHITSWNPVIGGRKGYHTSYLQPLLDEMQEVFLIDPEAEW